MFTKRETNEFNQTVDIYRRFILQQFPDINIKKYFVLGGYNLSKITWLMNMLHVPSFRFNFSGLISIMHPIRNKEVSCANRYRHIMVNRDIQSEFWRVLKKEKPQYLIMDFIEERYDVVEFDGGYLTKSDAFDECNIVLENARTIGRETKEYHQLWKQSCCDFIEKIKECLPKIKVILVKNYLSEYVGNIYHQESYLNREWIQKTNNIIRSYYDFFEEKCDFAEVIEASSFKYYYTDEEFEHGAEPSHLNNIVNKEIALKIESIMNY